MVTPSVSSNRPINSQAGRLRRRCRFARIRPSSLLYQMPEAARRSRPAIFPLGWLPTRVPSTVPAPWSATGPSRPAHRSEQFSHPRCFDEFNQEHDLAKYSHLPDQAQPLARPLLVPDGVHPWPAARQAPGVAQLQRHPTTGPTSGSTGGGSPRPARCLEPFSSLPFLTSRVMSTPDGKNCLAVMVHPMDHPGTPETQLVPFGKDRKYQKEAMKTWAFRCSSATTAWGPSPTGRFDSGRMCTSTSAGRLRSAHLFVTTAALPPQTSPAALRVSATLVNSSALLEGVLKGTIEETGGQFEAKVRLAPNESKEVMFSSAEHPALRIENPSSCGGRTTTARRISTTCRCVSRRPARPRTSSVSSSESGR